MSPMTLFILILLAGGLLSLLLFRKAKKLQWIIFFMSAAYLTALTISLYGKWELAETLRTEFFNLHLANTKMGWLFLAIPAFFASTAAFMYLYRGLHAIYLGQLSPRFKNIKAAPPLQSITMIIMMLAIFGVGAFPGLVLLPINEAVGAGSTVEVNLS